MKRFLIVSIMIFIVVEVSLLAFTGHFYRNIPVDTYYNHSNFNEAFLILLDEYETPAPSRTNEEYRDLITSDLNFKFYIYMEDDLDVSIDGKCIIPLRTITIKSNITGYRYCIAFAHEVMHFKKLAKQENYISFETFKYLYENDDEELHMFGVRYAIAQLHHSYPKEYDCSSQIVNYLIGR